MATDLERLVVQLSADVTRFNKEMAKARGIANTQTRAIENRFKAMNQSLLGSTAKLAAAFGAAIGARQVVQLVDASTRITNALKVAGLEGDKLTTVYEKLYASAQKNAVPLESLVTLYGRAAIVQKELGVSSEELLKFTDNVAVALRVAGTDAQTASGALLQLSQALGSGTVRAEEFNSILEGALPVAQAAAAGLKEAGGSVAKLRGLVIAGKISSEVFFRAFEAGADTLQKKVAATAPTVAQGFQRIQNAAIDAARKVNEGSKGGEQLAAALAKVATAISETDFGPFASEIAVFISDVRDAKDEIVGLYNAWVKFKGAAYDAAAGVLGTSNKERISTAFERADGSLTPLTGVGSGSAGGPGSRGGNRKRKTISMSDYDAPVGAGDKKKRLDEWQRETRQIQEATAALQIELGLVGQTEFARDKARAALELENAARRAGITDIEAHKTKIDELSTAYATAAENVRKAEDRFQAINELQRAFGESAVSGIMGLIDGTKTLNDVLADTLKKFAEMALQAAIMGDGPFATLFGGAGKGGGVGGIIGALFGRASGGPVQAGDTRMVGENGPELVRFGRNGSVVPASAVKAGGSGSAQPVSIVMNNDFRGVDAGSRAYIETRLAQTERRAVAAAVAAVPRTAGTRPGFYGSGR
jgi:tape measure domain-containing protein